MARDRAPELHLDFQEDLFGVAWKKMRRGGPREEAVFLSDQHGAVNAVVHAFSERRVSVRRAETVGGCRGDVALLPAFIDLGTRAQNREFLFLRSAITGALLAAGFPRNPREAQDEESYLIAVSRVLAEVSAKHEGFARRLADAAELELLDRPAPSALRPEEQQLELARRRFLEGARRGFRPVSADQLAVLPEPELPRAGFLARFRKAATAGPLLLCGGPLGAHDTQVADEAQTALEEEISGVAAGAHEVEAPAKDQVRRLLLEEDEDKEDMPEHAFEKVSFAEKYSGSMRRFDAEDDMEEHQDSLDAVDLRELIRGGPEAQSVYRSDIGLSGPIPDVGDDEIAGPAIQYDEWDYSSRSYKRGWATVYPSTVTATDHDWVHSRRKELAPQARIAQRRLEALRTEREWLGRQTDGDEIDISGLVEEHADARAGRTPEGRVYQHQPRIRRDIATTVLLDLSLSADSWVDDRRVLDVERDAAWVLGEVAHELGDSVQLLAFASNTRNRCQVWNLKDWDEPWPRCAARLGALKPQGYTRIGPALRHATAQLAAHPARHRHLILVTDAKPNDFDRYEGEYGIQDVRQAVLEARRARVSVHALGIDPRAGSVLPVMFGIGKWRIVRSPADLPQALLASYGGTG